MGKLQRNYNLVYEALETARLEESVNRPNENDGIMTVRIKTIKQFYNVVQDLRDVEGAVCPPCSLPWTLMMKPDHALMHFCSY